MPRLATVYGVVDAESHFAQSTVSVSHGKILVGISGIESPEVDDLLAMGVDDFDCLVLFDFEGNATTSWDSVDW